MKRPPAGTVLFALGCAGLALGAAPPILAQEEALARPVRVVAFTNVDYRVTDHTGQGGFQQGEISALLIAPLTGKLTFFGEFSAHTHGGGGHAVSPTLGFGVMRAFLRYDFADALKLSVGRFHPSLGYWPTAFHHGVWLETSVGTPLLFDRHEGALPGHFLGARAEGTVLPGTLGLGYVVGIGNGRHLDLTQPGDAGDVNDQRALMLSGSLRPPRLFGLQVGGSLYLDRVSPAPDWEWNEQILSAHLVWEKEDPEFLAEYVRMRHDPLQAGEETGYSEGYYAQLGYRLNGRLSALKPYLRAERFDVGEADRLMRPLNLDYDAGVAGVRFDFAPSAALKGEYRNTRFAEEHREHSLVVQVSFTFGSGGGEAAPLAVPVPEPTQPGGADALR